jgi:type VI secretion system secreted protein Hcp
MDVKKSLTAFAGIAALTIALPMTISAADMLLLIPDTPGSSRLVAGGIDVLSYSHGASNTPVIGTGGAGAGKVSLQDISITKTIDKSTPLLYKACASGKHFANVTLFVRRTAPDSKAQTYYVIKLEDVLISSVSSGGSNGENTLGQESVTMAYAKIATDYVGEGDPVSFSWDLTQVLALSTGATAAPLDKK